MDRYRQKQYLTGAGNNAEAIRASVHITCGLLVS